MIDVEVEDEGVYKCVVFNSNGEVLCEVEFLVEGKYWKSSCICERILILVKFG